ncbi:iron ABC transporter ATP-binding protein [Auritidibacter sp. NML120779]|nr:iron ABC transporter ATP-binding protein [Auritidibacter sp. NML120779]
MIQISNIAKKYSEDAEIGPIDLAIPAGQVTALVGPNGAGKSTLLTMIGRLQQPDTGWITVAGQDVHKVPSAQIAKTLAILRQENYFITRLTVRQLVGFGRYPHSKGRLTVDDERAINEALEFLNLVTLQDRYLDELSGGQRQRAYVAMVMAQETDYLLLDEPLNNLDMSHSVHMMHQLRRACDALGRTVVIVLHDINFAGRYADHIVAMKHGQISHAGPTAEIMQPEVLTEIFGTTVRIIDDHDGPVAVYF